MNILSYYPVNKTPKPQNPEGDVWIPDPILYVAREALPNYDNFGNYFWILESSKINE